MRRVGALSGSNIESCVYARLIGLNFNDFIKFKIIKELKKFWVMLDHPEYYDSLFSEKQQQEEEQCVPQDMTAEQFIELIGMSVSESGEGYAVS